LPAALLAIFDQTFDAHDLLIIALLIVLEGVLSIDNALVLGLLAKRLPHRLQSRALTYGLLGAFIFRFIAIATASYLLHWRWVKLIGGAYLVYVSIKHFWIEGGLQGHEKLSVGEGGRPVAVDTETGKEVTGAAADQLIGGIAPKSFAKVAKQEHPGFWPAVVVIELTDIAFAVDSILAAIALVGSPPPGTPSGAWHPKLWVVLTGGMLGVILMRVAAVMFIKLLERFPRFETSAYLLVIVIGIKLIADWAVNTAEEPHRLNFHDWETWPFWVFWIAMLVCFLIGFIPHRTKKPAQ
jgi:YkoY family integral membrane protein